MARIHFKSWTSLNLGPIQKWCHSLGLFQLTKMLLIVRTKCKLFVRECTYTHILSDWVAIFEAKHSIVIIAVAISSSTVYHHMLCLQVALYILLYIKLDTQHQSLLRCRNAPVFYINDNHYSSTRFIGLNEMLQSFYWCHGNRHPNQYLNASFF